MQSYWLPAHGANNLKSLERLGLNTMTQPDSPGYYPNALMSYVHWTSRSRKTRYHQVPFHRDRGFLFGDSGGFSISTLGLALDPIDVLQWQGRICSVGCLLDVPPHDTKRNWIWEKSLPRTISMTQRALSTYRGLRKAGNPFRWWGVVHGMPGEQQHAWWSAISEVYPFTDHGEGWALRPNPTVSVVTVADAVRFAHQHGIKRLHVLMCTQPTCVATLLCLATMAGLELVTYDSSTFAMSGSKRVIIRPILDGLSYRSVQEEFRATHGKASYIGLLGDERRHPVDTGARDFLAKECPCPGCVLVREKATADPAFWAQDSRLGYWFILHNFEVQRETFAALSAAVAADPEGVLRAVLTPKERGEALRAFEGREAISAQSGTHRSLLDYLQPQE